jgi:SAM-dependent methyltransferase
MAEPTSREECVDRHREYPIDIENRVGKPGSLQHRRIIAMLSPVLCGETVLDVGCNSGYLEKYLPAGCRYYGVDACEALVAAGRLRGRQLSVATAEVLPFDDKGFDVVVLGEIIEHVHDPVAVLAEAARVARRAVVGSTPHELGKWGAHTVEGHKFHVRCYTRDSLRAALHAAGLLWVTVTEVASGDGVPQMYVFSGRRP